MLSELIMYHIRTVRKAKATSAGIIDIKKTLDEMAELASSTNPVYRKGGVMGLAAIALGLGNDFRDEWIELIIRPLMSSLEDQDSQIRYVKRKKKQKKN